MFSTYCLDYQNFLMSGTQFNYFSDINIYFSAFCFPICLPPTNLILSTHNLLSFPFRFLKSDSLNVCFQVVLNVILKLFLGLADLKQFFAQVEGDQGQEYRKVIILPYNAREEGTSRSLQPPQKYKKEIASFSLKFSFCFETLPEILPIKHSFKHP